MRISIIIPTYNEAENIARLITHLKDAMTTEVEEIIISDGGSNDDTLKIAKDLNVTAVLSPKKGRAAQMNFGAQMATGDVLYFVHADTLPPNTFASDIKKAISKGADLGRYRTKFLSNKLILLFNEWATWLDLFVCMGGDQTLFIKKEIFNGINGFNEEMLLMEEYDLCKRARQAGSYTIMKGAALVSARKYEKNTWWRVQRANFKVVQLYKGGAPQQQMVETYKKMLNW